MPESIGEAADQLTGDFLKELGWDVKRKPVAPVVTAPGVDFGFTETLHQGDPRIIVKNKAARIE